MRNRVKLAIFLIFIVALSVGIMEISFFLFWDEANKFKCAVIAIVAFLLSDYLKDELLLMEDDKDFE